MQNSAQAATKAERRKARALERKQKAAARAAAILSSDGLLRLPEVLSLYPVSASTWWAGVASGRFPSGVKIGARCTAWKAQAIRALIESATGAKGAA